MQASGQIQLKILSQENPERITSIEVASPGVEGYILGRSDTATNYEPDIDLSPYGAQQLGISRRHAALVRHQDVIHVIDLGSVNGTFVNGKQITAKVAYALSEGDHISLGNLDLAISKS